MPNQTSIIMKEPWEQKIQRNRVLKKRIAEIERWWVEPKTSIGRGGGPYLSELNWESKLRSDLELEYANYIIIYITKWYVGKKRRSHTILDLELTFANCTFVGVLSSSLHTTPLLFFSSSASAPPSFIIFFNYHFYYILLLFSLSFYSCQIKQESNTFSSFYVIKHISFRI